MATKLPEIATAAPVFGTTPHEESKPHPELPEGERLAIATDMVDVIIKPIPGVVKKEYKDTVHRFLAEKLVASGKAEYVDDKKKPKTESK